MSESEPANDDQRQEIVHQLTRIADSCEAQRRAQKTFFRLLLPLLVPSAVVFTYWIVDFFYQNQH
jgi:hypothetical protein